MCGIVGYVGPRDGVAICLEGLHRLEYRGYDSAGIAVVTRGGLRVHKAAGKVRALGARMPKRLKGSPAIGHTRWATHGEPTDENAHPHLDASARIAIVHNGILENSAALRAEQQDAGVVHASETDSEVLAHLIAASQEDSLEDAVRDALARVEGTFGLAVLDSEHPDRLVVARQGSPVVLGVGSREMFVASDVSALVRHTQHVVHLDDGELAVVTASEFRTSTLDRAARSVVESATEVGQAREPAGRGEYAHFMAKEIFEQPETCERALRGRLDARFETAHLGGLELAPRDLLEIRRVKILGCGSAYYAGLLGAHMIETLARIPADAAAASEFRYRNPVVEKDVLYLAVSQSGETFDTLAAVQEIRRKGGRVLGVVNAVGSTIAREVESGIYLHAGPEVSVASTKTFTSTAVVFALMALHWGRIRDLGPGEGRRLREALERLPDQIAEILQGAERIREVAERHADVRSTFFIGRAGAYPIALEGAQKLKEVSYIHAEAYPAAELKHGPFALVEPEIPTVAFVPHDALLEKSISTLEEIRARRGPIIAVTHAGAKVVEALAEDVIAVPKSEPELDPILLGIPMQLYAYYSALALGRDVDQPRNLAKSVTVE